MYAIDYFPGQDSIPWALLIRARSEHDVALVAVSVIARAVAAYASVEVARKVASVVREVGPKQEDLTALDPGRQLAVLAAFADFDDICPPPWRPHPHPHRVYEEFGDALAYVVLPAALALTEALGSDSVAPLREALAEAAQQ